MSSYIYLDISFQSSHWSLERSWGEMIKGVSISCMDTYTHTYTHTFGRPPTPKQIHFTIMMQHYLSVLNLFISLYFFLFPTYLCYKHY